MMSIGNIRARSAESATGNEACSAGLVDPDALDGKTNVGLR